MVIVASCRPTVARADRELMRILVTGAYGFIGSHILTQLLAEGHTIGGAGRSDREAARRWPQIRWAAIDFNRATQAQDWLPHLAGIDAVVNCVRVLQDAPGNTVRAAQVNGTERRPEGCQVFVSQVQEPGLHRE